MNLQEIKAAIDEGKKVYWSNNAYEVLKFKHEYVISYDNGRNIIGLTWADNETLNGNEEEFFISE